MDTKVIFDKVIKVVLTILGFMALLFQIVNFIFGTLVKSSADRQSEFSFYINDFIPHSFSIFICIWYIIFQVKSLLNKSKSV